jgi:hypothetical protein
MRTTIARRWRPSGCAIANTRIEGGRQLNVVTNYLHPPRIGLASPCRPAHRYARSPSAPATKLSDMFDSVVAVALSSFRSVIRYFGLAGATEPLHPCSMKPGRALAYLIVTTAAFPIYELQRSSKDG